MAMVAVVKGFIDNLFKDADFATAYEYEEKNDWVDSYKEFEDGLDKLAVGAGFKNAEEFSAYLKEVRREVYEDFQKKENRTS